MENETLRIGIVGMGRMGLVHSGILSVLPNVELVAVCEKNRFIRRFAKNLFRSLNIVDNLDKLEVSNLNAVFVTTPIPSHFPVAKTILENNISKNLFVEKTLAQTYEEARLLVDLAQSYHSVTMVGYLRRFYVTFNKAKELLRKSAIGKVESFQAYAYSSDFLEAKEDEKIPSSRGGVLRDLGCYAIDLALWFFGDLAVEHNGAGINNREGGMINFTLRNSEVTGELKVSWQKENYRLPEVGFSVVGSEGKLFVNDDQVAVVLSGGKSLQWYRHDLNDNVPFWLALPEYYREDLQFVRSLRGESEASPDFRSGASVDKIIDIVLG